MNNKGFTLIELLVSVVVVGVIMIVSSDFLINLLSASTAIQSKVTLEQNYSFVTTKLTKLIQEADSATLVNSNNLILSVNKITYNIKLTNSEILINNTPITNIGSVQITSDRAFQIINQSNPVQIKIKLDLKNNMGTKAEATQNFERIVTLRKSYKN